MARLIRHEATGPVKIDTSALTPGRPIWICACGLSQNMPYCDGSHKPCGNIEKTGKLYVYDRDGKTIVEERDDV